MARKPSQVKDRRLRVIWSSNGVHTNSGYGVFQRDLLFRMARDGWPVAQIAFWGIEGFPVTLHGEDLIDDRFKGAKLKVYSKMAEGFGSDALYPHAVDFRANVVMTMQDQQILNYPHLAQLPCWIPYTPVDKDPLPHNLANNLSLAYKVISFSKFGQEVLAKHSITSTLILEGTDPEIFKPLDKEYVRKELNLPRNLFVFGMVAANKENPPRKGFQEALLAFKRFQDNHPEAAFMIHTQQPAPGGFPLKQFAHHLKVNMAQFYEMDFYKAVWGSDSFSINKEMNAMDVLLHPSQTEGFGLTVIEAQSAGTPVLVNRTTSMPELVVEGVTGEICETQGPKGKRFTNDLSWVEPADPDSLYDKMEILWRRMQSDRAGISKACRDHVVKNFNINTQYEEQWKPFFEKIQTKLLGELRPIA